VSRIREGLILLSMAACSSLLYNRPVLADESPARAQADQAQNSPQAAGAPQKLVVTMGKALIIDSPLNIMRVHVANGELAEAVAVNPKEVLINGRLPGETSLIVWQQNGSRLVYDLSVRLNTLKLEAARAQINRDFPNDDINLSFENDTAFVRGRVKDVTSAERVMTIAATLGKAVNLLRVDIPAVEPQILLRVRFANVDRSTSMDAGLNLFNGSFNQETSLGPGSALVPNASGRVPVTGGVNVLLLRPDINLVAELQALQVKRALELLAEPNVLAISGEQASFLAGGEFPFPIVQPGSGGGGGNAITLMWREYGVRLNFLPVVTPRGTIRLKVAPEVSSLDYTNAVSVAGLTVPGIASRRVQTEVELESGQTFVIAGLLDNQTRDSFSKVPGIGDIPILGKLFQSKNVARSNSELLVIITPELVRPIPAGQAVPEVKMPNAFLEPNSPIPMRHPTMEQTGPVPVKFPSDSLPYEQLVQPKRQDIMPPTANPMTSPQPQAPPAASAPPPGTSAAAKAQ
jgi:pilus assembly protein CpaC